MVATLDRNLRSGYRNEDLGVYLLRTIAAVAHVQTPEDVGWDGVATLLTGKRRMVAGLAFYIQLKSVSLKAKWLKASQPTYTHAEVRWLAQLQMPFMLGFVHPKKASIELFNCCEAIRAACSHDIEELTIVPAPRHAG